MANYPSKVSDSQQQVINKYLDKERKREQDLQGIFNTSLYLVRIVCQWPFQQGRQQQRCMA